MSDFHIVVFFFSRQNNISYLCIVVIKNYSVCCGQFKPAQAGLEKGQVGHSPRPGHQTPLVTSSGVHWKPVQTHLALPPSQEQHLVVATETCTVSKWAVRILLECFLVHNAYF